LAAILSLFSASHLVSRHSAEQYFDPYFSIGSPQSWQYFCVRVRWYAARALHRAEQYRWSVRRGT
jgi:hypothetical protein